MQRKSRAFPTANVLLVTLAVVLSAGSWARASEAPSPLLWPEEQRAFLQDGPGLLLSNFQLEELLGLETLGRERFILTFLDRDPIPNTAENELLRGIEKRRALVTSEGLSWLDDRAKLLFLHGPPLERRVIDCTETYKPLEIWSYGTTEAPSELLLYRPRTGQPYRLWLPLDSKRVLYNPEMEYWLEQWEELRGRIFGGRRFDRELCRKPSKAIDRISGVDGMFGFQANRPKDADFKVFLEPPDNLAEWARRAAATEVAEAASLDQGTLELFFPERAGQRVVTRMMVVLPPEVRLEPFEDGDLSELRLTVEGYLELEGKIFEEFRVRFQIPTPESPVPLALAVDRSLRPGSLFLARLKVREELSGRELDLVRGFAVPDQPTPLDLPPVPEDVLVALGEQLKRNRLAGHDSLVIVPPETDVVFGLWRAEVLVTGESISRIVFYLDDQQQMSRRRPPFTAELRLETYPREQIVRVEGYDEEGELVAQDEVILNQPRGELQVRILDPPRGRKVSGKVKARAEIVVPEERRVELVEFSVNDQVVATLERPPWEAEVEIPANEELVYLTVAAQLEDGQRAEDVRFMNAPDYIEEIDVNLVELFTTVTDRSGTPVGGLTAEDFQVFEDKRPQELAKFELVVDQPLTIGITIDTSGSMLRSLGEAQRAAVGFLDNIVTAKDRCFAVAFADRPVLLMPRTADVGAVAERIEDLVANGSTSLHDAIVTSLYYYRGIRGRRALVLLSDGEDTASTVAFREALEYAKRSGVSIYSIGLRIPRTELGIRNKLENLSKETGGRHFFIDEAHELSEVYAKIEKELRSQYLLAYSSDQPDKTGYREVEVKVKRGMKARTIRGYYK